MQRRFRPARLASIARRILIGVAASSCVVDLAVGSEDEANTAAGSQPTVYLDVRTNYTSVPANVLSIGLGGSSLSWILANPELLSRIYGSTPRPAISSPSSRGLAVDVPLTVDVNDRVSLYGGFTASASQSGASDWSALTISSWNVGFQADVHQQNGGTIPTITVQSTLTRSVPDSPLATTSLNTIVEFDYALNEDETRGFLVGAQQTLVGIDSPLAKVGSNFVGYLGGYYQLDSGWKFSGRAGIQSFGGAQILNLISFASFTQPILRLDMDRMDDNDNRLFGVTAQLAWTPKPAYQLTIRTPLYATRN